MEGVPPMRLVKGRQQAWGTTGKRPQTPKPAAGRLSDTCHGELYQAGDGPMGNCRVVPTGYQKHDRTPSPSVELRHPTSRPCGWSGSHCYVPMLHSHLCCRSRAHKRLGSPELEPRLNHPKLAVNHPKQRSIGFQGSPFINCSVITISLLKKHSIAYNTWASTSRDSNALPALLRTKWESFGIFATIKQWVFNNGEYSLLLNHSDLLLV